MKSISHFSIKKPVTTSLVIIIMLVAGFFGLKGMSTQLLPDFDIPVALVNVVWVGASPEDVDKLITDEVQEAIKGIDGIDEVKGYSSQNSSAVVVQFKYGTDVDEKVREIQTKINNIKKNLPGGIEEPVINKIDIGAEPILIYNMFGSDLTELYRTAEDNIKPALEKVTGVAEVKITGGLEEEVRVEVDPNKLAAYNLNVTSLKGILASSNINVPLGSLMEGDKAFIVKVRGEIESIEQVKNVVISNKDGMIVRLSDVADVKFTQKDIESYARQNGKDSVRIEIIKAKDGNTIAIAKEVKNIIKNMESALPGMEFFLAQDNSVEIDKSIASVKRSAIEGIILSTLVLLVFLKNFRATLIVSVSLPVSVIFTFALLYTKGITLNIISLMGLALGIGLLVDNSIVVMDNIFRRFTELKEDKTTASGNGAAEMAIPLLTSTLTIVAVFLPVVLKKGMAKEIFHDMSYSISFSLLASLIVALVFVPMAASKFLDADSLTEKEGKYFPKVKNIYEKFLIKALKYRARTLFIALALFVVSLVVGIPNIRTEFMPQIDSGQYSVSGTLAKGLDVEKADRIAQEIERIVKADKFTKDYSVSVTAEKITVNTTVADRKERKESIDDIISEVRGKLQNIPDVKLTVANSGGGPGGGSGGSIELKLYGSDLTVLKAFSEEVLQAVKKEKGLVDIQSSYEGGNPELVVDIDRDRAQYYGLNVSEIATFISYQVKGTEAFTIKSNGADIDVTVRLAKEYRNSISKILDLDMNTPVGPIKLKEVASLNIQEGASTIEKEDGENVITISGNPDGIDLKTATEKMKKAVESKEIPTGIRYDFGGNQKQFVDVMKDLLFALAVSVFLIYFILAMEFESFTEPFIIMMSLPLSIIGVLFGVVITGIKFNIMVMIGIIMLCGIVVNNAIVLIDYVKVLREKGYGLNDALREAGKTRLRPIIMTKATAEFGMFPLALGIGEGSEYYQGMAIAIIFGLTFSTLLTLFVIPVLYSLKETMSFGKGRKKSKQIEAE